MQNTKFCALLIALVVLAGTFFLSPAISSLMNNVVMKTSGQVFIWAKSGYWRDIQDAVNLAAQTGIKNVRILEGTYNFVNVGESWTGVRVVIPAGINLFGAPTERDANDQVIEWKTVLIMPSDVSGNDTVGIPRWFQIGSEGVSTKKNTRFSDIKLVGYRTFNESSTAMHVGVRAQNVLDFRVDHCCFLNTAGGGVHAGGSSLSGRPESHYMISGVIDHCVFVNTVGVYAPYERRTVGYGVYVNRGGGWPLNMWEPDITKILGSCLNYTVFVEDCYFEKWRHCVVCRSGAHIVLRYSTIKYDYGYGSVDIHGDVPGRALEIYDCILEESNPRKEAVWWRAGGGVVFNNIVSGYDIFLALSNEYSDPEFYTKDVWIWNNTLGGGVRYISSSGPVENQDYFLYAPSWYIPHPYPHHLTIKP